MHINSIWMPWAENPDPVLQLGFVREFARVCEDGFHMRFHERNGGNLSYWLKPEEAAVLAPPREEQPWHHLESGVPELAGEYFLITASGSCFRNICWAPQENLCIIRLNETGDRWQRIWGLSKGGRPTSELESHLMNMAIRSRQPDRMCRVMYHAHPERVIALSSCMSLDSKTVTRALWSSMVECSFLFPYGVGVVEGMIPGGAQIGEKTAELMAVHDAVLWAHHGLFCAGIDFDSALGLMEAIDKAAGIQLQIMSTGNRVNTIPDALYFEAFQRLGGKMNKAYVMGDGNAHTGK